MPGNSQVTSKGTGQGTSQGTGRIKSLQVRNSPVKIFHKAGQKYFPWSRIRCLLIKIRIQQFQKDLRPDSESQNGAFCQKNIFHRPPFVWFLKILTCNCKRLVFYLWEKQQYCKCEKEHFWRCFYWSSFTSGSESVFLTLIWIRTQQFKRNGSVWIWIRNPAIFIFFISDFAGVS